jgi:ABC-type glutathione transport system ATPase component
MSLVSIRDVRESFGANEVLKGVSLEVAKGDVVAIIGRSGSGKSTCSAASTAWRPINPAPSSPTASKSAASKPICASCAAMSAWFSSSSICSRI